MKEEMEGRENLEARYRKGGMLEENERRRGVWRRRGGRERYAWRNLKTGSKGEREGDMFGGMRGNGGCMEEGRNYWRER